MKKMKRFLVALLSCVTAIACVAGLSACNKEQPTSSSTPAVSSSSQETSSPDSSSPSEHVHSGGTATCTAKAVCAECEEEYGELAAHAWGDEVAEVKATCTEDGTEAHFACECGALAQGEEKTVVTAEDLVIPAGHIWGDEVAAEEPDCVTPGKVAYFECECGAFAVGEDKTVVTEEELVVPANGHEWVEVAEDPATCTEAGTEAYFDCANCEVIAQLVEEEYVEVTAEDLVVAALNHIGGTATCQAAAVCERCETAYGEVDVNNHVWGEEVPAEEATCTVDGKVAYFECACGALAVGAEKTVVTADELVVVANGHAWEGVDAQSFCTEEGWVAHFVCTVCGVKSLDRRNEVELRPVEPTGHTPSVYVPGFNADCVEDGQLAYYECEDCDAKVNAEGVEFETVVIPAHGHNLVNAYDVVEQFLYDMVYDMVFDMYIQSGIDTMDRAELMASVELAVMMGLKMAFPNGRTANGMYCDFGLVCEYCFDAYAWGEGESEDLGYVMPGIGHRGGEATCSEGAYCELCNMEYTAPDYSKHVEEVAATCSTYAICGECFNEYGEYDLTVEGHNFSELVVAGAQPTCFEAEHYAVYMCADCGQYAYKAEGFVMVNDYEEGKFYYGAPRNGHTGLTAATCTEDATCSVCELSGADLKLDEEDDTIYVAHHVWAEDETPVTPALCGKDGVKVAHTDCVNCDVVKVAADNEAGFELKTEADVVDEAHDHTIVDATCTEDAYCACEVEGCNCEAKGAELGEDVNYLAHHVWTYVSAKIPTCTEGGKKEYYDCDNCDVIAELVGEEYVIVTDDKTLLTPAAGHYFLAENVVTGFAKTCDNDGRKDYYTCSNCDAISLTANSQDVATEADLVIPASHVWGEEIPASDKTCTENGKEAYFECEDCHKFAQGEEKTIVTEEDLVIPMSHEYGEEVEEVPASCTAGTEAHYVCADCGKIFQLVEEEYVEVTEEDLVIEAVGHSNEERDRYCGNKIPCTTCGKIFEADEEGAAEHTWLEDGTCQYCDAVQESDVDDSNPDVVLPEGGDDEVEDEEEGGELV